MKIERDERKFDFHGIGLAIKKAREREGMTQEQLGYIVDRDPRTIMYHENDGQHPSLNAFYHILYCKQLGINYKNLSEEEFRWFIRILKKSKKMGTPISQRKKR